MTLEELEELLGYLAALELEHFLTEGERSSLQAIIAAVQRHVTEMG